MDLEEQREKVKSLREYLDFQYQMTDKYGCSDNIRKAIKDTLAELAEIENINTMRPEDFVRFRNGEFGFI